MTSVGRAALPESRYGRIARLAADGLAAGAIAGCLDLVLAYSTADLASRHAHWIGAAPLALWFAVGGLMGALAAVAGSSGRHVEFAERLVWTGPIFLSAIRGGADGFLPPPRLWVAGARILVAAVALGLLLSRRSGPEDGAIRTTSDLPRLLLLTTIGQAAAALVQAVRLVPPEILQLRRTSVLAGTAGVVAAGYLVARVARHGVGLADGRAAAFRVSVAALWLAAWCVTGLAVGRNWSAEARAEQDVAHAPRHGSKPSILLVTLDTTRVDHLSCYGYSRRTTPRLDALARRATLFRNAYSPSPYTLAAHASLFTGLLPSQHGARPVPVGLPQSPGTVGRADSRLGADSPLGPSLSTLAEALQQEGYRTGAVVGNYAYLARWTGLSRGFGHYEVGAPLQFAYPPLLLLLANATGFGPALDTAMDTSPADRVTDSAMRWLEASDGSPSFLFVNYFDPHYPYSPPAPFDGAFLEPGRPATRRAPRIDDYDAPLTAEELSLERSLYDGEIAFVDQELGRLLDWLGTRRLLDPMLVIVTGDHGELFGEHGLIQHGPFLYDELLRVPLIVKLPGQRLAGVTEELSTIRRVPSLIRQVLAGSPGEDALRAPIESEPIVVLAEQWVSAKELRRIHRRRPAPGMRAVYEQTTRLKWIQGSTGDGEIYDLGIDPAEKDNLRSTATAAIERFMRAAALLPPIDMSIRGPARLSTEDRERLRSLGYLK